MPLEIRVQAELSVSQDAKRDRNSQARSHFGKFDESMKAVREGGRADVCNMSCAYSAAPAMA